MTTATVSSELPGTRHVAPALRLDHLRALEAESIHIMREVVAEFERPVMLYSIGKDSSVLLRLAQKAFYPGPIPVSAAARRHDLQVPRDDRVPRRDGQGGRRAADRPHQHGGDRRRHAAVQGRHAALLRAAEDEGAARRARGRATSTRRSAARAATRSDRAPRSASSRCATRTGQWDPKHQRPELWHLLNEPPPARREHPRVSALELDRDRRLAATSTSSSIPIVPLYFAKEREVIVRGNSLIVARAAVRATAAGRAAAGGHVPHAIARLLAVHRRGAI